MNHTKNKIRPKIRIYGEKNTDKFKEYLGNADWHDFYNTEDEEKCSIHSTKIYNNAFNKTFALKELSRKRTKDKLWITTSLIKYVHHKEKLFQNYVLNP